MSRVDYDTEANTGTVKRNQTNTCIGNSQRSLEDENQYVHGYNITYTKECCEEVPLPDTLVK